MINKTTILFFVLTSILVSPSLQYAFAAADSRNTSPTLAAPLDLVDTGEPGAIIGNGDVILGINKGGQLNVDYRAVPALGLPPADPAGVGSVGLRDGTGALASTEPGCECEGWGLASLFSGLSGFLNDSVGSSDNIHLVSFTGVDGGTTAVSVVEIHDGADVPTFRVTHDFHPSAGSSKLYEVEVTVKNISPVLQQDLAYRRVMDWDVFPTPFDEFVTIFGTATTSQLIASGNNGFLTADPTTVTPFSCGQADGYECTPGTRDVDFTDVGPDDIGSVFDFDLGDFAPDEEKTFKIFYGNAPTEVSAISALTAVNAELYSLGQSNTVDGPTLGTPVTFMFAFGDVGGKPLGVVGGEKLSIDNSALLIAGLSANAVWILPMLAGLAGAGIYLTRSKTNWI